MKKCLLIVLVLVLKMSEAQVTNYQINKNTSNNVIPYKIYNSNDGNLLLSNVEPNWDVGSNHVLKVKPNGDTIFIKSTDAEQLFVTSTGNIITNATVFQILYQNYTNSSINFYDKNYNIKWSLDLSSNLQQLAPWQVWGIRSPPIVSNFFEITPNHFICETAVKTNTNSSIQDEYSRIIEFDSLGSILNMRSMPNVFNPLIFFGKTNSQVFGYDQFGLFFYNYTFYFLKSNGWQDQINSALYYNHKIYTTSKKYPYTYNPRLSCFDTLGNVLWSKKIDYSLPSQNFILSDLVGVDNKLICQYKSDSTFFILNFDTLGNLTSSQKMQLNIGDKTTNLALLNNNIYTTNTVYNNTQHNVGLIKMDLLGNYDCSETASITTINDSFIVYPRFVYSLNNDSISSELFTNLSNTSNSYSVSASNGCLLNGINYNNITLDNFNVWPNPSNGKITLQIDNKLWQHISITIIDVLGNEIYTSALLIKDNLANFNLNVSAGTYFVKVSNNSTNEVVVKKIVIQ